MSVNSFREDTQGICWHGVRHVVCEVRYTGSASVSLYLITMVIVFQGQQTLGSRSRIVEFKQVKNAGTGKV